MTGFWTFVSEPLAFEFMRQALIISILVASASAVLSCFLVLKGWSLMGDAMSHAVLPGVVLAYVAGLPLVAGAFAAGMVCALSTGFLKDNSRIKQDTIMGVVFSGMFALGIVLYTKIETDVHLDHILFGNMLGVGWADIAQTGLIALVTLTLVITRRRDLLLYCFDPQHARAVGLKTGVLHYGLLAILSLTIVGSLVAVGIILAIGMLIAPGAIAYLLTDRFDRMLFLSVVISVSSSVTGVLASFHIDSAPAPTIILVLTAVFIAAFLFAPKRGVLVRPRA